MPVGNPVDAVDNFRLALSHFYKKERDRAETCLADIIDILSSSEETEAQVRRIFDRMIDHYERTGRGA